MSFIFLQNAIPVIQERNVQSYVLLRYMEKSAKKYVDVPQQSTVTLLLGVSAVSTHVQDG